MHRQLFVSCHFNIMDVIVDASFSGIYDLKLTRFLGAWICVVIARKFFSDEWVDKVVMGNQKPKPLENLVWVFLGVQLCFEALLATGMALLANVRSSGGGVPVFPILKSKGFLLGYCVDVVGTVGLAVTLSLIVASVLGNRTRFDYIAQGPRAARATEEIMVNICAVSFLVPFFLLV